MLSLWQKQSFSSPFFDIVIVGSGLSGLLTAYYLKKEQPKLKIVILEKGAFPEGASAKNAGFACFGSVSELLDDQANEGLDFALQRVFNRYSGLQKLRAIIGDKAMNLQTNGGFEVFTPDEETLFKESSQSIEPLNQAIAEKLKFEPYSLVNNNFGIKSLPQLIKIKGESAINSGKLLESLLNLVQTMGVTVRFNSNVNGFNPSGSLWETATNKTLYRSSKLIFATNGFSQSLFPKLNIIPGRGQVLLTSPLSKLPFKGNFHIKQGYFYFRPFQNRVLLGGGRHLFREQETTTSQETTSELQTVLEDLLHEVILPGQNFTIEQRWAGTMAFGAHNEKEVLVKELEPGLYINARFGGMGIALAAHSAERLSKQLLK